MTGNEVIAINDNYQLAPWANHLYSCDGRWWAVHQQQVDATFTGQKWTQAKEYKDVSGFNHIESISGKGLSKTQLVQGCNSGYQAINLAYILGADIVALLGYDMSGVGTHWFGKHDAKKGLGANTNYANFIREYEKMHPQQYGIEVINCTRETALHCFPRMTLEYFIAEHG